MPDDLFIADRSPASLDSRAARIRDLVNVARGCIVEVGRELIQAKAECRHGDWLPWIEREFGWSERVAQKYMSIATAFKSAWHADLGALTIDAEALNLLATQAVPQDVRDEAVDRAKAGDTVTLADAEVMVAERVAVELHALRDKARAESAERIAGLQKEVDTLRQGGRTGTESLPSMPVSADTEDQEVVGFRR